MPNEFKIKNNLQVNGSAIDTASSTFSLLNSTPTTINAFGAATSLTLGYNSTATNTTNIATGATASGSTKTINIGTGGAAGSTTAITIGDADGGTTVINSPSLIVPGNFSVGANIAATTGPVLTLGTLSSNGSGYMNGTHTNQALTGGTGSFALATVVVSTGFVTSITLTWGGHRYTAGDTLTVGTLTTNLLTTAASGTGTTATLTFAAQATAPFQVGSQITVVGVTPTGYNGTYTVTACTTTSVSYANTTTGAQTVAGTIAMGAALTNATIPVATIQGADVYVSSYTTSSIGARVRLESNDTTVATGQEYGAIAFASRDNSAQGSGDVALIRGVSAGISGGSDIQFWTAANGTAPVLGAVVTSAGNFRMYDSTGAFYTELSNTPTANRTVTIPDVAGTALISQSAAASGYFDTSTTTPTGTTRLNYGGYLYPTSINLLGTADTTTTASHYFVETASDGFVRPKTLANVRTEIVTTSAVNSAAATTVGTVTSGTWNATAITDTYLATISTAGKVSNSATTATSANTASAIVARDASGNFSAGTITAITGFTGSLTGNASTATKLATAVLINGVSFDGSADITIPGSTALTAINDKTANYTLVVGDVGKLIQSTTTSAITITVPTNATAAIPIGSIVYLAQDNTGSVTISGAVGVTLKIPTGYQGVIAGRHSMASLIKIATDTWRLVGDLLVV